VASEQPATESTGSLCPHDYSPVSPHLSFIPIENPQNHLKISELINKILFQQSKQLRIRVDKAICSQFYFTDTSINSQYHDRLYRNLKVPAMEGTLAAKDASPEGRDPRLQEGRDHSTRRIRWCPPKTSGGYPAVTAYQTCRGPKGGEMQLMGAMDGCN